MQAQIDAEVQQRRRWLPLAEIQMSSLTIEFGESELPGMPAHASLKCRELGGGSRRQLHHRPEAIRSGRCRPGRVLQGELILMPLAAFDQCKGEPVVGGAHARRHVESHGDAQILRTLGQNVIYRKIPHLPHGGKWHRTACRE
ncbi:MAG: hypothetical protein ACREPP_05365 [Rhodanobacteraceae bacterium]